MEHSISDRDLYFLGKLPPQCNEVEEIVLGTILIEAGAYERISQILTPECFYLDSHRIIFKAMQELNQGMFKIDLHTIVDKLKKSEEIDLVGGMYFIINLSNNVSSTANLESHAKIVFEKYMLRQTIAICQKYINLAYSGTEDPFELLDDMQLELAKITAKIRGSEIKHISDSGLTTLAQIVDRKNNPIEILGLTTGIKELDKITCGLIKSDLTIIAARPSHGKSTLGLQIASEAAINKNVLFFSLEMTKEQLVLKTMSASINESVNNIRMGKISDMQMDYLSGHYFNQISESGLYLYDKPGISIYELVSVAKQMTSNIGLDLIVVDYLQFLTAIEKDKKFGFNREQEIAKISKTLKNLAKELDIPVISLSQLKRPDSGRKALPTMSDLRESGAIEQDADNIWLLCRPHFNKIYELELNGEDVNVTENMAILEIAKCRMGTTGVLFLDFYGYSSKFLGQGNDNRDLVSQRKEEDEFDAF